MPLNERKTVAIIAEECLKLPERCDGYRKELLATLSDIIQAERQHRTQGTNIQQKVNDKCSATGQFLATRLGHVDSDAEG